MERSQLAGLIDHAMLAPDATNEVVRQACRVAVDQGCAGLALNGSNIKFASILTKGSPVKVVAVIGGFPLGRTPIAVKAYEAGQAVKGGADELDLMINLGAFKECSPDYLLKEVGQVVQLAEGRPVKVILETCYLTDQEKVRAALLAGEAGASWVETSTGFGPGGATVADVALLRSQLPATVQIKASGGLRGLEQARSLWQAGAARLGCSATLQLLDECDAATA
ncbi:MAG: deoxyribose-phosphate aldolase [Propionibacteriaceae bacterium]|jgi:deoxyribose-phosphate aldolase|nr:deoxyribose-phosphate aldolase [Propionibacteriaceae bacterium]